jgi:hypothetical protein
MLVIGDPKRFCQRAWLIGCVLFTPGWALAEGPDQSQVPLVPVQVPGNAGNRREVGRGVFPPRGLGSGSDKTPGSPEQKLERAKLAYQRGDYGAVVLLLRPLLYPQTLLAQEEQVLLSHKLLSLSYYFEHDEAGAEQEFNLLLSLRPDFSLDPVVDPLQAVAFLDDIRRRNAERLQEIRHRQAEEEERHRIEAEQLQKQAELLAQQRTRRIYIERVVHRRFSAVDLLPFGVPQLVARRRALGAVLLVSEALTGAASLSTWLSVRFLYPTGQFPSSDLLTTQALTGTYLGSGVVFWGLVLVGLVDALLHSRTVTEIHELQGPPPELRDAAPHDSLPPLRTDLLPVNSGGLGLSLGVTF